METTKRKATRKIKKFDFSDNNSTVALVGPVVGGPANGITTLITKSNRKVSEAFIEKASQITVTMTINEYLTRFFHVYDVDSEILARSLGFVTEGMDKAIIEAQEEQIDMQEQPDYPGWETEPGDKKYEDYVNYKVKSISVMKQLHEAENLDDVLAVLTEEQYLQLLQDQEVIEKALVVCEESNAETAKGNPHNSREDNKNEGKTSVVKRKKTTGEAMSDVTEQVTVVALQKALDEQKVALEKAMESVAKYEQEKVEAINKSKLEQLVKAADDKSFAEIIFKACAKAEDADYAAVVKAVGDLVAKAKEIEKGLFVETGASVETTEQETLDPLQKLIKSQFGK